ncbi:MAG TPA: TonB-dependent receptor, partial [Prolixibacteraceae bacterium]|nr:TonB-dependent receptor [Prolixibacteraceae bacterium]
WRLEQEPWMEWALPVVSTFKLRGSWGTIGDQSVPNSLYIPTMSGSFNNWLVSGVKLYQFSTPGAVSTSVTWQDITTLDLGLDARFFNNSLGVIFDWFRRDTENMIVPQEGLPATFGTGAPQSNYGSPDQRLRGAGGLQPPFQQRTGHQSGGHLCRCRDENHRIRDHQQHRQLVCGQDLW